MQVIAHTSANCIMVVVVQMGLLRQWFTLNIVRVFVNTLPNHHTHCHDLIISLHCHHPGLAFRQEIEEEDVKANLTVTEKRALARKEALVAYDERVGRTPKPVVWAATKKRKTKMARKMGGGVVAAMSHTHAQRPAADLSAEWVCETCSMKNPLAARTCSICARPATVTAQSKPRKGERKERNKVASNIPHQPGIGRIPGVMSSRRRRAHQVEGARAYDVIKTGQSDSARLDVILSKERPLVSSPMIGGRGGRSGRSGRSGMSGMSGRSGGTGSNLFGGSRGGRWGSGGDDANDPNPWSVSEWHRPGSSDSMQQNNYNNNDDNSMIRWGDVGSNNDGDNMHWAGDHDAHYDGIGDSGNGINHTAVTAMMWDSRVEQSEGSGGGGAEKEERSSVGRPWRRSSFRSIQKWIARSRISSRSAEK